MPIRVSDAALVRIDRDEAAWIVEQVVRFLDDPPEVLVVVARIVVGEGGVVEIGGVDRAAIKIPDGAVDVAVKADVAMAVKIAAKNAELLCAILNACGSQPRDLLGFLRMHRLQLFRGRRGGLKRSLAVRQRANVPAVYFVFHERVRFREAAAIASPGCQHVAIASGSETRAQIVAAERVRQRDGLTPRPAVIVQRRIIPQRIFLQTVPLQRLTPDLVQFYRAAAQQAPDIAARICQQLRLLITWRRQLRIGARAGFGNYSRRKQACIAQHRHARFTLFIERRRDALRNQKSGVFAPVGTAIVPRDPGAIHLVAGNGGMRLKAAALCDLALRGERARRTLPQAIVNVVRTIVVGVPRKVNAALRVDRDGGFPCVARVVADREFLRPLFAVEPPGQNARAAVAISLPDNPQISIVVERGVRIEVGPTGGDRLQSLPAAGTSDRDADLPRIAGVD